MQARAKREDRLAALFDRRSAPEALNELIRALRPDQSQVLLKDTAIAIDANVFLRLSAHVKSADILDYFTGKHAAPVILPGQAIQEFWNNQLQAVDSLAASVRKKFEALREDISRIDPDFGPFADEFNNLMDRFSSDFGYAYDEGTRRKTTALLEMLQARAIVPYAPRSRFTDIAAHRKKTKTPPGFKDEGDGDFFVWVDMLTGLMEARASGADFLRVVFVTLDKKIDWSRDGIPHPILSSEIKALFDVPFEIWTLQKLAQEITSLTE